MIWTSRHPEANRLAAISPGIEQLASDVPDQPTLRVTTSAYEDA